MKKQKALKTYQCTNCGKDFTRYQSTVRNPDRVFCCNACRGEYQKTELKGRNNPNYRHGIHMQPSKCACGNEKDYRAEKCAVCAKCGFCKPGAVGRKYLTDDEVRSLVASSKTFVEAAKKVGVNRKQITARSKKLGIDTSHFKIDYTRPHRPLETTLVLGTKCRTATAKRCLLYYELKENKCEKCGQLPLWFGAPLTLELHHINRNPKDNRLENLQILCPNCHTQIHRNTFRKRKKSSK